MGFSNPLNLTHDPFGREAPTPIGRPVQSAFDDVMREIGLGTAVIVVAGPAGSGKTLLLDLIERAYSGREQSVRRIERGDLAHTILGQTSDLLLVDEADSVDQATLEVLLSDEDNKGPRAIVFACRSSATPRFAGDVVPVFVKLTPLAPADARNFLVERATSAGRPDLFEPEALDMLIAATKGLPQLLQSIGGHALFFAAYDQAIQVCPKHVSDALAAQLGVQPPEAGEAFSDRQENDGSAPYAAAGIAAEPEPKQEAPDLLQTAPVAESAERPPGLPIDRRVPRHEPRNHREPIAVAFVMGAVLLSFLLLDGGLGEVKPVEAIPATATRAVVSQLSTTDALRAMERVAKAVLPRPVILALIAPTPLQPLHIANPEVNVAAGESQVISARQSAAKGMAGIKAQPPSKLQPLAPAKNVAAIGENLPKPGDSQPLTPPPINAVPESAAPTPVPEKQPVRSVSERDPSVQLPNLPSGRSANYLSPQEMSRALFDISARAGFDYDHEYPAFKACVLEQVSADGAEAEEFRNAVRHCAQ